MGVWNFFQMWVWGWFFGFCNFIYSFLYVLFQHLGVSEEEEKDDANKEGGVGSQQEKQD